MSRDLKDSDNLLSILSHRKADVRIMFLPLPDTWGWWNGAGKSSGQDRKLRNLQGTYWCFMEGPGN